MHDDAPPPPLLFANHVLLQCIEHMVGGDMLIEGQDFTAMRVAFRKLEGSWENLIDGDLSQLDLLKKVVTAWAQMPGRKNKSDEVI